MGLSSWVSSVVGWLRAGYPEGVPASDYVPLVAVLSRRLSTDEVREVAHELVREGRLPVDDADIGTVVLRVLDELPSEEDVARVRERLARGGWPLADPRTTG